MEEQKETFEPVEVLLKSKAKLKKLIERYINYQNYGRAIMRSKQKYAEGIVVGIKEYKEYIQLLLDKATSAPDQATSQACLQKIYFSWANHKRHTMPWPTDREHNEKIYDKDTMDIIVEDEIEIATAGSVKNIIRVLGSKARDEKKIESKLSSALAQVEKVVVLLDEMQAKCSRANKTTGENLKKLLIELNVMLDEFNGVKTEQSLEVK